MSDDQLSNEQGASAPVDIEGMESRVAAKIDEAKLHMDQPTGPPQSDPSEPEVPEVDDNSPGSAHSDGALILDLIAESAIAQSLKGNAANAARGAEVLGKAHDDHGNRQVSRLARMPGENTELPHKASGERVRIGHQSYFDKLDEKKTIRKDEKKKFKQNPAAYRAKEAAEGGEELGAQMQLAGQSLRGMQDGIKVDPGKGGPGSLSDLEATMSAIRRRKEEGPVIVGGATQLTAAAAEAVRTGMAVKPPTLPSGPNGPGFDDAYMT